jgi:hypothetical protein
MSTVTRLHLRCSGLIAAVFFFHPRPPSIGLSPVPRGGPRRGAGDELHRPLKPRTTELSFFRSRRHLYLWPKTSYRGLTEDSPLRDRPP